MTYPIATFNSTLLLKVGNVIDKILHFLRFNASFILSKENHFFSFEEPLLHRSPRADIPGLHLFLRSDAHPLGNASVYFVIFMLLGFQWNPNPRLNGNQHVLSFAGSITYIYMHLSKKLSQSNLTECRSFSWT